MKELLLITIGAQIGVICTIAYIVYNEIRRSKLDTQHQPRDPRRAL
ncbi:hypothetical protein ACWPKS_15825 [Coraliomargarita sp. W4R72]